MATDLTDLIGQHHLCPVGELLAEKGKKKTLSEHYALYRWWFPEDSPIMTYLHKYIQEHPDDFQMQYLLDHCLQKLKIGNATYYALYFGKSTGVRTRFKRHVNGAIKNSTLRKTISAILLLLEDKNYNKKKRISEILMPCYFEWMEFLREDEKLIDGFEIMAISIGRYPLNLEDNPSVSKNWIETISNAR